MSRILVTGATGYLGTHVLAEVRRSGADAVGLARGGGSDLVCDLLKPDKVRDVLARVIPDTVVHCAAAVPKAKAGYDDQLAAVSSIKMVEHLCAAGARRVVFTSSMTVYGSRCQMPAVEDQTGPDSVYGRGKLEAERRLLDARDVMATIVRLPGLFGPPRESGIVFELCSALVAGRRLKLPDAAVMWAAMHVADAASLVARVAIQPDLPRMVMNIGYPEPMSISRLVRQAASLTGARVEADVEHPVFQFDLMRLQSQIGLPAMNMRDRLIEMIAEARRSMVGAPEERFLRV